MLRVVRKPRIDPCWLRPQWRPWYVGRRVGESRRPAPVLRARDRRARWYRRLIAGRGWFASTCSLQGLIRLFAKAHRAYSALLATQVSVERRIANEVAQRTRCSTILNLYRSMVEADGLYGVHDLYTDDLELNGGLARDQLQARHVQEQELRGQFFDLQDSIGECTLRMHKVAWRYVKMHRAMRRPHAYHRNILAAMTAPIFE